VLPQAATSGKEPFDQFKDIEAEYKIAVIGACNNRRIQLHTPTFQILLLSDQLNTTKTLLYLSS